MSDDAVVYPKLFKFSVLKRRLKKHHIYWRLRKGKGGHGSFVGPAADGEIQSYPLPTSQHREVRKVYLKGLCRRFELTNLQIKELFE